LRYLGLGDGIGLKSLGGVIVNVNETGSENEAFGVDDLIGFGGFEIANFGNAGTGYAEIGFAERSAGSVGELGVDDDERFLLAEDGERAKDEQEKSKKKFAVHEGSWAKLIVIFNTEDAERANLKVILQQLLKCSKN
jgi:hypothetical protein